MLADPVVARRLRRGYEPGGDGHRGIGGRKEVNVSVGIDLGGTKCALSVSACTEVCDIVYRAMV